MNHIFFFKICNQKICRSKNGENILTSIYIHFKSNEIIIAFVVFISTTSCSVEEQNIYFKASGLLNILIVVNWYTFSFSFVTITLEYTKESWWAKHSVQILFLVSQNFQTNVQLWGFFPDHSYIFMITWKDQKIEALCSDWK